MKKTKQNGWGSLADHEQTGHGTPKTIHAVHYNADGDGERCVRTVRVFSTRIARYTRVVRVLLASFVKEGDRSGAFRLDSSHVCVRCGQIGRVSSTRFARDGRVLLVPFAFLEFCFCIFLKCKFYRMHGSSPLASASSSSLWNA